MTSAYYLRNQWYVVAHDFELETAKHIARTICDVPMLIFRGEDDIVGILHDRCPHRMAPLSSGKVSGADIQCGYHGLKFSKDGACTHIPGRPDVPRGINVKNYSVRELYGFIWVWLGDKPAEPNSIPNLSENKNVGWAPVPGYLNIACNYQIMIDNILDLAHFSFVHPTTLADDSASEMPLEVSIDGDKVISQREMKDVDTVPIYRLARGLNGKIDRWQIFEYSPPGYIRIELGAKEAGDVSPTREPVHVVLNLVTPETESRIHYFWSTTRPWGIGDKKVDDIYKTMFDSALSEDKHIVESQQAQIDKEPSSALMINLSFDKAAMSARRVLKRLMEQESKRDA